MPGSSRNYRIISSAQTLWVKFSSPIVFVVGGLFSAGVFYLGLFAETARLLFPAGFSPVMLNAFWGFWILFGLFGTWWGYRLKRVAIDGDSIYVSDYFQEAKLPLSTVLDIRQNRWIRQHTITIIFSGDTPWGSTIKFMPKIRFLVPGWFSHPIVAELKDMVYWSKAGERVSGEIQQQAMAGPLKDAGDAPERDLTS